jgi:hypothetical protein
MSKCPTDNSERLFELKMTPQLGPGNNPTCCLLNGLVCAGGVRSVPPHHLVKEESLVRQKYDRCNETNNFYTPTVKVNVSKSWTSWNEKK